MSRLTFEQLLPEDLVEPAEPDEGRIADDYRDSLADLDVEHTYPETLTEGALFRRQAQ